MKLENAKALVTGGSEGIGRGIASALVGKGADVVITGRNELALAAAAKEIGAGWIAGDVGVEADAVRTVEEFVARHGRIDILVNNAGFGTFALLVEMTPRRPRGGLPHQRLRRLPDGARGGQALHPPGSAAT